MRAAKGSSLASGFCDANTAARRDDWRWARRRAERLRCICKVFSIIAVWQERKAEQERSGRT